MRFLQAVDHPDFHLTPVSIKAPKRFTLYEATFGRQVRYANNFSFKIIGKLMSV